MSHFTVLVIGDDVEGQLAPFHEFECTGENDQYVQDIDVTEECVEYGTDDNGAVNVSKALEYHGLEDKIVSSESDVDRNGRHKFGYAIVQDGKIVKAVNRTNPNKKWDWYQIGGRWSGYFKLKALASATATLGTASLISKMDPDYEAPGQDRADQCRKGDIDLEGMRDEKGKSAGETYDLFKRTLDGLPPITPWPTIREKHSPNIDAARTEYHEQPGVKALRANDKTAWLDPEDFECTRDEHIERARRSAGITFAVVKDSKWYESGSMGWWGCVSDEKDPQEWQKQFASLLDGLPDTTLLTVVDCHI